MDEGQEFNITGMVSGTLEITTGLAASGHTRDPVRTCNYQKVKGTCRLSDIHNGICRAHGDSERMKRRRI